MPGPLAADFGPGAEAVAEGRADGRVVCLSAPFRMGDYCRPGAEAVADWRAAGRGVLLLCAYRCRPLA